MERDETLVHKWLKTEYPKIKKMAKAQGADIYFGVPRYLGWVETSS
jgi:hypothetical protein